jgi:hypothetical protein
MVWGFGNISMHLFLFLFLFLFIYRYMYLRRRETNIYSKLGNKSRRGSKVLIWFVSYLGLWVIEDKSCGLLGLIVRFERSSAGMSRSVGGDYGCPLDVRVPEVSMNFAFARRPFIERVGGRGRKTFTQTTKNVWSIRWGKDPEGTRIWEMNIGRGSRSSIWKRALREETRRLQVRRWGKDWCFVPELGINSFGLVSPRFDEFRFVTKDPLPTNPLAAVTFIIIKYASVFEFGGTIRNFLDKREKPIGSG